VKEAMIKAKWVDQTLLESAYINGIWTVHSVFRQSFNLQDSRQRQLICISGKKAFVPKGIIIEADAYNRLAEGLTSGTKLLVQQRVIHFLDDRLSFQTANVFETFFTNFTNETASFNAKGLWAVLQSVEKLTGYQEPVSQTIRSRQPFCLAIDQLCTSSFKEQRQAIAYLLGRGMGLTPTGDDMLVGHLLARQVMGQADPRMVNYLKRMLETTNDLTTDVSRHYLVNALSGFYSRSYLELANCTNSESFHKGINEILRIGHTSGADFLAGFARSMNQFQNNRNEELLWQNEWSSL
jgi:hypothetical protein